MQTIQLRAALLWLIIVVCYFLHGYYHLAELFYGVKIELPDAKGEVPLSAHLFSVLLEAVPLSFCVMLLYPAKKAGLWISLVFAALLFILNAIHLFGTLRSEIGEVRQVVLLAFILVVNFLLIVALYRTIKQPAPVANTE